MQAIPLRLGILATERVDPCVERTDDPGPGAADLHGLRQIPESVEKTAHREFRGDAAALGAADPVGDRRHHLPARLGQLSANDRGGEVLIPLARPFFGAKSDTRPHAGVALRHRMQLPSTFLAAGAAPPPIAELRHPALIEEKVSPGRRGENDGQRARLAIERITPAVFAIAPPDLRFIDAGGICIDGLEIVIDRNSPSRAAVRIGASDGDRFGLRGAAACRNGRPCHGGNCRGSGAG